LGAGQASNEEEIVRGVKSHVQEKPQNGGVQGERGRVKKKHGGNNKTGTKGIDMKWDILKPGPRVSGERDRKERKKHLTKKKGRQVL